MTIADNLTLLNSTKADIKAAIEAKGVDMTGVPFTDYDTKISTITSGEVIIPNGNIGSEPYNTWTRNSEWLTMPTLTKGVSAETVNLLVAVYNNDSNAVSFQIIGDHTIDWGDGVTENFLSGVTATHVYSYSNAALDGTLTSDGYKQAIIKITPQAGQNLTTLFLNRLPYTGQAPSSNSPVLEMHINAPQANSIYFTAGSVKFGMVEYINFVDTAIVTSFGGFADCYNLRKVDIGNLNMFSTQSSFVTFFNNCLSLEEAPFFNMPISAFNATSMFQGCTALKHVPNYVMTACTNTTQMFSGCSALQYVEFSTLPAVTTTFSMFDGCYTLEKVTIGSLPVASNVSRMFQNCTSLNDIPDIDLPSATNTSLMFTGCNSIEAIGNVSIPNSVTTNSMFNQCVNLKQIGTISAGSVTNCASMFVGSAITALPTMTLGTVANTSNMFNGCSRLEDISGLFSTAAVTDTSSMFNSCQSIKTVPALNLSAATTTVNMFFGCRLLKSVGAITTGAGLTTCQSMFNGCSNLEAAPAITLRGTAITVFSGCGSMTTADNLNMSAVTDISSAFLNCFQLQRLPDTFVFPDCANYSNIFSNCFSLKYIPTISFPSGNTTQRNFSSAFNMCQSLQEIDIVNAKVSTCNGMFSYCYSLKRLNSNLDFTAATASNTMFAFCGSLKEIIVTAFPTVTTGSTASMFTGCTGLSRIVSLSNMRQTFTVTNCFLGPAALNEIYTALPTITAKTITVTNNWGTLTDTPSIATAKGWTVTG